jgi:hypothetical protein
MTITGPSQLAEIPRAAANAYHIYEQSLGYPDRDWPTWYAFCEFTDKSGVRISSPGRYGPARTAGPSAATFGGHWSSVRCQVGSGL